MFNKKTKSKKTKRYTPKEINKIVQEAGKEANRSRAYKKMGLDPNFEYAIDITKSGYSRLQPIKKRKK